MNRAQCKAVTTMEEAKQPIAEAILPISGLRRDSTGMLTSDALNTVLDSLRSRGIDLSNKEQVAELLQTASEQICILNEQYQFVLRRIMDAAYSGEPVDSASVNLALEKNQMMLDILTLSRQINQRTSGTEPILKEGFWQASAGGITLDNSGNTISSPVTESQLKEEQELLHTRSYVMLREHAVEVTEEKNRSISRQLGLYGFLNLVAIGLLLYISMGR